MAVDFFRRFDSPAYRLGLTARLRAMGLNFIPHSPFIVEGASGSAGLLRTISVLRNNRAFKFPGMWREPRAARATIQCPAQAAITDDSTVTLDDGAGPMAYEFDTDSSGLIAGDILVDVSAAVTPADVAAAFAAAITAGGQAFTGYARADGRLHLIARAPLPGVFSHVAGTFGVWSNNPITPSIPGEWPGIPAATTGGKQAIPGVGWFPGGAGRIVPDSIFTNIIADPNPP